MKGALKWFGGTIVLLLVLVIAAVIILPQVINPNDYREKISQLAYDNAGINLKINGDINWSVFPWLGLGIRDLSLQDVDKKTYGTLQYAAVKVNLVPLLSKKLDISTIELKGLNLDLVVDKNGKANWQPAPVSASASQTQTPEAQGPTPTDDGQSGSGSLPLNSLNVAGVAISDISVTYKDIPAKQEVSLQNARLETGAIRLGQPFQMKASFDVHSKLPALATALSLEGKITPDLANNHFTIDDMKLQVSPLGVKSPVSMNLLGNAALKGSDLNGQIKISQFDLATFMQQLKMPLPKMKGGDKVLRKFGMGTHLEGHFGKAPKSLSLTKFSTVVDDIELKGRFAVTDLDKQAITFNFTGNDVVVDPYLPVAAEATAPSTTPPNNTPSKSKSTGQKPASAADVVVIPVDVIRELNIKGQAQLTSLTTAGFRFDNPSFEIHAVNGYAQLKSLKSGFYKGSIDISSAIDVRGALAKRPQVSSRATIQSISLPALAEQVAEMKSVTGTANASMRLVTHGLTQTQLTRGLNGTGDFNIANGALLGTNFNEMVCGMIAMVRKEKSSKNKWEKQTRFDKLSGSVRITEGVIRNNDLVASLDQLNLKGDGNVNLVNQTLDYHLGLTITGDTLDDDDNACRINKKYADISWPLRCHGSFNSTSGLCGIDEQRLGKTLGHLAEEEIKNKLQKKLEEKLGGSLKGLFN